MVGTPQGHGGGWSLEAVCGHTAGLGSPGHLLKKTKCTEHLALLNMERDLTSQQRARVWVGDKRHRKLSH